MIDLPDDDGPDAPLGKSDNPDVLAISAIAPSSPKSDADEERDAALQLLANLKLEHRRIDQEISALSVTGVTDMLKISRMKKIKLSIKDQIAYLENETTPDIIA